MDLNVGLSYPRLKFCKEVYMYSCLKFQLHIVLRYWSLTGGAVRLASYIVLYIVS